MNKIKTTEFSRRLNRLIKTKGINQKELARAICVSGAAVSGWLKGAVPSSDKLTLLAGYFGVTTDELLLGNEGAKRRGESEARIEGAAALGDGPNGFEAVLWLKGLVEEMVVEATETRAQVDASLVRMNEVLAKVEKLERAARLRKTKGES